MNATFLVPGDRYCVVCLSAVILTDVALEQESPSSQEFHAVTVMPYVEYWTLYLYL